MINTKYEHLGDFRALVVMQHSLVLFILTYSCGGQSQVIGSSQPIVAIVGDDVILPCQLEPAVDAREMTVEWARPDLKPKYVFLRRDGTELQRDKHPMYKGRTSLSEDKLRWGDISLKLTEVKLSDSGAYRCIVLGTNKEYVIKLTAGSVSLPTVSISKASSGVDLQCKSEGWYPEPEVLWLDSDGNLLSAGSTEIIRDPNDLYTVSSRVTVERRHNNMFTCRVTQNNINQTREALIHVSDELFMVQSSSIIRITICIIVCFVSIVAVVLVVRKCGQNKKNKKHHEGETDLGERKMLLDKIKANQDEKLEMKDKELEHVQQVITTMTEQKKNLELVQQVITTLTEQKKDLELVQQVITTLTEQKKDLELVQQVITTLTEQKKDLEELKRKITSLQTEKKPKKQENSWFGSFGFSKEKNETLEETKEDLEKRKTIHELLTNTYTQLYSTDALINRMTEWKQKLENDKEQIEKHLKETERKREEVQKQIQRQRAELQRQREELQRQREELQRQREEVQRKRVEEEKITKEHETQSPEGGDVRNNPSSSTNIQ
ncbi:butyrophilin subfamily 2 member A1 [Labrus bergylta]|uniref:butyrophilin subfamily 2 member A1 n=1 Tax=Labrus bergylta TaxID=56723 RepID=UPI0033139DC5